MTPMADLTSPSPASAEPPEPVSAIKGPAVVLIEDEPQIRRFLRTALGGHDYRVFEAATGRDGLVEAATRQPDLVILDLGLPDIDGLEVLKELRSWSSVPVIVLSARGQERDKIMALDGGADDYVEKPFSAGELLARMRAALRRRDVTAEGSGSATFQVGELSVDLARRLVVVAGKQVHLTPIEYKLLTTLIHHAGKVVTHRQLLREVWGPTHSEDSQYLRVYVAQLRRKLEQTPVQPKYLLTEPGVGYRLAVEP
jgi:two-component system, OmpR family, KDP operon response regulator KdpE